MEMTTFLVCQVVIMNSDVIRLIIVSFVSYYHTFYKTYGTARCFQILYNKISWNLKGCFTNESSGNDIGQYVVATAPYQGRIDSCEVTFPSASGRACNTRFKFIIWPCLFTVRPMLSPIDLCRSM